MEGIRYSQTQQTLARPHLPIGTPPIPRHCRMDWQLPSIDVVAGFGEPGIIVVTRHAGPCMKAVTDRPHQRIWQSQKETAAVPGIPLRNMVIIMTVTDAELVVSPVRVRLMIHTGPLSHSSVLLPHVFVLFNPKERRDDTRVKGSGSLLIRAEGRNACADKGQMAFLTVRAGPGVSVLPEVQPLCPHSVCV